MLRRLLPVLALAPALAACGGSSASTLGVHGEIAPVGERVAGPSVTEPYLDGGSFSLASLRGKVVVLNVFGSWCPPCQAEQPELSQLADAEKSAGVEFVGLAERSMTDKIKGYESQYGMTYPAINDDTGSIIAKFKSLPVSAIPSTLVFDKSGREAARFVGPATAAELKPVLASLTSEAA